MGQKANITTLQKTQKSLNLLVFNSKIFFNIFHFLTIFEFLLKKKNVIILDKTVNFVNNKCFINLQLFYQFAKLVIYKRKKIQKRKLISSLIAKKELKNLFFRFFNLYKTNIIILSVKNSNKSVDYQLFSFFQVKTKSYIKTLFSKRFNLYLDFLKLTSLFYKNKIHINSYAKLLSNIFTMLSKRAHGRFLVFIRLLLKLLSLNFLVKKNNFARIIGLKFKISGKLKGKLRSSSVIIQQGLISTQSIGKNISFSKVNVLSLLGTFGFKLWSFRK